MPNNIKKPKILFLTQFFDPDIQATSKLFKDLCEDLAVEFNLKVLCGNPLVEPETIKENDVERVSDNNYKISRVYSSQNANKTILNRMVNHMTFAFSFFFHSLFMEKPDLIIFTSDNPLNYLVTFIFSKCPKIYLCQDLYLEQGLTTGFIRKGILAESLRLSQDISFRRADKIIVIGNKMKKYLMEKNISEKKIDIISNWVDTSSIEPVSISNPFSTKHRLDNKFVVMHSGRIGVTQDLGTLIKCADKLKNIEDIAFLIIGGGINANKFKRMVKNRKLKNVTFLPYQPDNWLKYSLGTASVSVILYEHDFSHCMIPSRLYSFMASSRPVIASVDADSEIFDIITEAKCGITITLGSEEELGKAILKIYENRELINEFGQKGRKRVIEHYARSRLTKCYIEVIKKLLEKN